ETFEMAVAAESRMAAAAEPVEPRLALRIDLAGVVGLAFLFVAQQLVGRVEFGELHGGPRGLLVGVVMQLFRLSPERLFDLVRTSRLLHPQDLIGVGHFSKTPSHGR